MDWQPDENMKRIDAQEAEIIEVLGPEGALDAITKALPYDTKRDIYAYIIRCYDLKGETDNEEP